jgi:ferrous iron transport protein B
VGDLAVSAGQYDRVIVVLDATALASSLYLCAQVLQTSVPVVAALTMNDRAGEQRVDAEQLSWAIGVPVVEMNPRNGHGATQLTEAVTASLSGTHERSFEVIELPALSIHHRLAATPDEDLQRAEELFEWVQQVLAQVQDESEQKPTVSDRIDTILLKPFVGIPVFLAVLWATFQLTTTVAGPIQDWFDWLISGLLSDWTQTGLAAVSAPGWVESLIIDGLYAGVGTVLSFLPLMIIIFTMIFVLEDSGYLARVAVMADRAMQAVGLDGRAILPLVIGFGCNIPALSATKTIPDSRQRLLTGLLVPYSSCTARLVIYLLLATVFFPNHAGTVVFGMYLFSVLVILGVAFLLRRTVFRRATREPLLIVLPGYQFPRFGALLRDVALRCSGFVKRAGVVILGLSVAVWVLMAVPVNPQYSLGDPDMPVQSTLFGSASSAIAPVFAPAGFDDWHIGAALITGFVAKESVVGTLATTYGLDEPEDPSQPSDLTSRLRDTFNETSGGHGAAAAIGFMVFCLVYTPCLVTVGEQRRLFGGKVTAASVVGSILLAWVLAVVIFQVGALLT